MTSSTYTIKHTFLTLFIALVLLFLPIAAYVLSLFDNISNLVEFISFAFIMIVGFRISYYITTVNLNIQIHNNEVTISKTSGILSYFQKHFKISDVEYYLIKNEYQYDILKLQIKNQPILKLLKVSIFDDDFGKFTSKLSKLIDNVKEEKEPYNKQIPILAEKPSGLWVAIVLGSLSLIIIIFGKGVGRFVPIPATLFFIYQVIDYRRKKK